MRSSMTGLAGLILFFSTFSTQLTQVARAEDWLLRSSDPVRGPHYIQETLQQRLQVLNLQKKGCTVKLYAYGGETLLRLHFPDDLPQKPALLSWMTQPYALQLRHAPATETPETTEMVTAEFSKRHVKNVVLEQKEFGPQIRFTLTPEGRDRFAFLTRSLVGQPLHIWLDNERLLSPVVQEPITDGELVLTGNFTLKEARTLTLKLQLPALAYPLERIGVQ